MASYELYTRNSQNVKWNKKVHFPTYGKSDFTFGAYAHRQTTHTYTHTHAHTHWTDSDRRQKIMNLNINLKYLFCSNEIQFFFSFFFHYAPLLLHLSDCFYLKLFFPTFNEKLYMWNEKFDLPRESSFQLCSSSTCFGFLSVCHTFWVAAFSLHFSSGEWEKHRERNGIFLSSYALCCDILLVFLFSPFSENFHYVHWIQIDSFLFLWRKKCWNENQAFTEKFYKEEF